ncbi:amidohydrolase family protein [Leucothrix arctica]|uniref:Amidohydrolase n=1 Tax=Leucothrix arctica TaxID=1481894 RepID=A0A317CFE0_9GAMM|nr:amidohydrolase family protein [Leucothrix arctica]PWQ94882.1 amidohydrolase [Leucothrix arctica]
MPRVDAHHHFWDPLTRTYPWMVGDALSPIRRPFSPEDLKSLLAKANIDKTVLVQTVSDIDETREFLKIAVDTDYVAGVVGWVDLTATDITQQLNTLKSGVGGEYLVGIRHQVHDENNPDWISLPEVMRGITAIGEAGLVYDLLIKERELPASILCIKANPNVKFVIDHIAKPTIASGELQPWSDLMTEIAAQKNVWCKLSGMVTEANWDDWTPQTLAPYVNKLLALFGDDKLMFGSDWPVCLLASDYAGVTNALENLTQHLDQSAKEKLWGQNAMQLYSLKI